jgi:hypothetical protein
MPLPIYGLGKGKTAMTTIFSQSATKQRLLQRLRRGRALIVVAVALTSLLVATVAIGQASQNFDLACRGMLAAGGLVTSNSNFAVIGAVGSPIIPPADSTTAPTYAVRSTNFGVRAGFLPAYPNGVTAEAALQPSAAVHPAQGDGFVRLPLLFKVGRIIRGDC